MDWKDTWMGRVATERVKVTTGRGPTTKNEPSPSSGEQANFGDVAQRKTKQAQGSGGEPTTSSDGDQATGKGQGKHPQLSEVERGDRGGATLPGTGGDRFHR